MSIVEPDVALGMPYRSLGRCGTKVSAFGLGGWTTYGGSVTDATLIRDIHKRAFDAGINFFDSADVYAEGAAEQAVGAVLADFPRDELVISSKVFFPMGPDVNNRGLSRKHIMSSIDKSLRRMGLDYLDIYFCHRFDDETPIEETARAMDDLIRRGKILYWGTSEWKGDQLREVAALCDRFGLYRPQVEQPRCSLLSRRKFEQDVQPTAAELGMGLVTWSPLFYGMLTGKYDDGIPADSRLARIDWLREDVYKEELVDRARQFKRIAEDAGCSRARLALAWVARCPGVSSVILGASSMEQLDENLSALDVEIGDDLLTQLNDVFPVEMGK